MDIAYQMFDIWISNVSQNVSNRCTVE